MELNIAVIGPGDAGDEITALADEVGALLGEAGATVVCGGLGGVMEAAARGARRAGGATVGILPGADRAEANAFLDVVVPTGMGELRNALVVRAADAVVAIGGGHGTLSEIGFALRAGLPVVGLRTWELSIGGQDDQAVERVEDPAAAAVAALRAAQRTVLQRGG